jgi:hypothetical protein
VKLKQLEAMPPWEWPRDARDTFKGFLRKREAAENDRLIAAELSGETVVVDDEIAGLLSDIVANSGESETLRATAAMALGPVLEQTDLDSLDDQTELPEELREEPLITPETFARIKSALHSVYQDESVPKLVRRRVLESAVRAQDDWHADAIRAAYAGSDEEWKLTAVSSMYCVPGFEKEILEALNSPNEDIHYEAIRAAGNRELAGAWPHVKSLMESPHTPKNLLIAAITASVYLNPSEAGPILAELSDSDDEDIAEVADEAMLEAAVAAGGSNEDDEFEEDDEDEEDEFDEEDGEVKDRGYLN